MVPPQPRKPIASDSTEKLPSGRTRTAHTATFKTKPTGPPTITPTAKSTIPLKVRQLIATKLYDQYVRIYQHNPSLATNQTRLQEDKIHSGTINLAGYKQMAMTTIMNLKKRPVSLGDHDIGIDGEWVDPIAKRDTASALYERALEAVVDIDLLQQLQYPLPDLLDEPHQPHMPMVGTIHGCDRCKGEYLIKDVLDKNDMDSCVYHPSRMKIMKVDGIKEKVYGCCEDPLGSTGCNRGPHVYKDEDLRILHQKKPYLKTPAYNPKSTTRQKLVALDCEMGYTTAGMELIRLTAVDQDMKILLDELVLPSNMIIDLNTHYSGIKTLEGVKYDLDGLRNELFKYVDEDTIIVGHGLENDMNALRIIHTKIIDTVALFPHRAGLPYRNSLRGLSSGVLKKFIQVGTDGHDSFEDARVCIELLQAYIKKQDKLKTK
ncbi:ribonuclease H-like domain-containing protein [Mucor mucedo]|uniref:ribonuclease H-like domain-containing protein n=1 Tax=Mucor mucedo TaxID=29922 RepID=UPI00221F7519|nr:ribonuclease H-like domain-containing protein [Mucor mucedo]KAI7893335.1 ribonuclease H-like domain-containing protein [Mucor mucedo]